MPADEVQHVGRWYHPSINPELREDLKRSVSDVTDLEVRRKNNRVGNAYHDVDSKLDTIACHAVQATERLVLARQMMPKMLAELDAGRTEQNRRLSERVHKSVEFYDLVFAAHTEGLLIQSKALLDSLVQFYSVVFDRKVKSFSGSGSNAGERCGRNLLNDLSSLGIEDRGDAQDLEKEIRKAKEEWIDRAVVYRNEVVHFGQLRGMRCHLLRLTDAAEHQPDQVAPPTMPDGQPTDGFIDSVVEGAHSFTRQFLRILFDRIRKNRKKWLGGGGLGR
jgi:hypothetical protein